jgi:UDP-glucose 4-epimerase
MKKVFVTGGAGYIGSHCVVSLAKHGYEPIILDNFSNSNINVIKNLEIICEKKIIFCNVDINDKKKLKYIFTKYNCYGVIHCAGFKAVEESIKKPIYYFKNNIGSTLALLECMDEEKIFKLIFSSSATVYNVNEALPWQENSKTGMIINPYGNTKFIIEKILMDIAKSNPKWKIGIARYFNPISNHSSGLISDNPKGTPNNLIPYIVKVAKKELPYLKIYGKNYPTRDGTCIRDYIHVMDLAKAHIDMLSNNKLKKGVEVYNFGSGKGSTVLEVVKEFQRQTGINIPIKFCKRRKGDVAQSYCSINKAYKNLKWKPINNLSQAIMDIKATI